MDRLILNIDTIMHQLFEQKKCIYKECKSHTTNTFHIKNSALVQFQNDNIIKSNVQYSSINLKQKSSIGLCNEHKWLNEYIQFTQSMRRQARLNTENKLKREQNASIK